VRPLELSQDCARSPSLCCFRLDRLARRETLFLLQKHVPRRGIARSISADSASFCVYADLASYSKCPAARRLLDLTQNLGRSATPAQIDRAEGIYHTCDMFRTCVAGGSGTGRVLEEIGWSGELGRVRRREERDVLSYYVLTCIQAARSTRWVGTPCSPSF
jgi:hypothetical protein